MTTRQPYFLCLICILLCLGSCRSNRHSDINGFRINLPDSDSKTGLNKSDYPTTVNNNVLIVSPADKEVFIQTKKGTTILNKKTAYSSENTHKIADYRPTHIKKSLRKAVTNNSHTSGFTKGLLMILLALLLFGLGYIFYTSLGVIGLIFFIIFGIAAAIYFIAGLVTMLFG